MNKRTIGLILIFLGVAVSSCLLAWCTHDAYLYWQTLDSFKAEEFPRFWDFYQDWCFGESFLSITIGTVFVYIGIRLRR